MFSRPHTFEKVGACKTILVINLMHTVYDPFAHFFVRVSTRQCCFYMRPCGTTVGPLHHVMCGASAQIFFQQTSTTLLESYVNQARFC